MKIITLCVSLLCSLTSAEIYRSDYTVKLAPVHVENKLTAYHVIGTTFMRGPSGNIYKVSYGPWNMDDSPTHINIHVSDLAAIADQIPTLGKSVSIHGEINIAELVTVFGLVPCDANGNDIEEGIE
jgi:hypothetical protein